MHFKTLLNNIIYFILFFSFFNPLIAKSKLNIKIETNQTSINFSVEIADTKKLRERGLMFRTKLKKKEGMLFIFPYEKIIKMWMKNTQIPLDIIFISEDKKIVDIVENTKEMTDTIIVSKVKSKYVLEINSGLVKDLDINIGDNLDLGKN